MNPFGNVLRLLRIHFVLMRNGLDEIILITHLFRPLRFIMYLNPIRWQKRETIPRGKRIRNALEELGPIFVKFGQILSTRRDLLPDDIAEELAYLQDSVQPFSSTRAQEIIEQVFDCAISDIFTEFNHKPLASASVAQVHSGVLYNGREVAIKVLRPGIGKIIKRDISLLYLIAGLAERYWKPARRLHLRDVVSEFEHHLMDELDLQREAANASQLRRNFSDSNVYYVPEIMWEYTRRDVMVMERIYGISATDISALKAKQVDLALLAERGVEIFFTQVFRDSFFHADMHAGNVFVDASDPDDPTYIGVDFGIMGTLSPNDQRYLAENLLAFFQRDYRRVAELHVESEWVPAYTRVDEFESAIRTVCEPIFERPLKDISFGQVLLRLFQTARRFEMELQPQLVLLQKTLLNVEGLGRQLYPELDLWATAKPFMENWMKKRVSLKTIIREFSQRSPYWAGKLPEIPDMLYQVIKTNQHLGRYYAAQQAELSKMQHEMRSSTKRTLWATIGCTLLLASAVLLGFSEFSGHTIADVPVITGLLALLSVGCLLSARR